MLFIITINIIMIITRFFQYIYIYTHIYNIRIKQGFLKIKEITVHIAESHTALSPLPCQVTMPPPSADGAKATHGGKDSEMCFLGEIRCWKFAPVAGHSSTSA